MIAPLSRFLGSHLTLRLARSLVVPDTDAGAVEAHRRHDRQHSVRATLQVSFEARRATTSLSLSAAEF